MDKEYDHKFEEMKKYIPFLESMIKRLESTSSTSNPRQAQLNKIRSLRDLLMDKKKRMKMENLLKCEQVLINLYAKVEQRDSLPELKKESTDTKENETDLNIVRKKLQTAVSKLHTENEETLPEIARASATEEICVPGSKEPALFQRRPNVPSASSSTHFSPTRNKEFSQISKRNYTRVLLSPETSQQRWSIEDAPQDKPLFSRRSPKKSPKRLSPTYYKKERRKPKNKSKDIKSKDLNITLNVPEESLNSLNTKDILSRIINCSDSDVDIATLRELRTQILGELKDTGANDDISDIILKSYKKKDKTAKTEEIEEGELSDSESEAIESIYGSLVIVDKDKSSSNSLQKLTDADKPRKIQICLVINSDKSRSTPQENCTSLPVDKSDFETFNKHENESTTPDEEVRLRDNTEKDIKSGIVTNVSQPASQSAQADKDIFKMEKDLDETIKKDLQKDVSINDELPVSKEIDCKKENLKPNFYTPMNESKDVKDKELQDEQSLDDKSNSQTLGEKHSSETCSNLDKSNFDVNSKTGNLLPPHKLNSEILPLETTKNVSEIDILQALKKEILSETNSVLPTESVTPMLHLPKVTKVVNANEIGSKKRISIENYKAKTSGPTKPPLSDENVFSLGKDDVSKKQSLKLTEKECERFNFLTKIKLDTTSDDEDKSNISLEDIYNNLAPKSPDHEDFADTGIKPPVIIPSDPIETASISIEADIDMRKILPILQAHNSINSIPSIENMPKHLLSEKDVNKNDNVLIDPRVNRENISIVSSESPNRFLINSTLNHSKFHNTNSNSPVTSNSNHTSAMGTMMSGNLITSITANICNAASNMTPNRSSNIGCNMTPNARTFEMTPIRQSLDDDDSTKHVYAPLFQGSEPRDAIENQRQQWDTSDNRQHPWEERDIRGNSVHRDIDYRNPRNSSLQRDINMFEQYPRNDRFMYDNRDLGNRLECPLTPNIEFSRIDCANTLNPPPVFGRMDCPNTPNSSFGRMDCPSTPSPSFGRMDTPMTPLPSFGRSECPSTPNHPFGRPEPFSYMRDFNQSFGKSHDPRLNRNSDYDNYHHFDDNRERGYFQERKFNSGSYKKDNQLNNSDYYRRYQREQSVGRNERNKSYDQSGRNYREPNRESSDGQTYDRDYESDRYNPRHRGSSGRNYEYRHQNQYKKYDDSERRSFQREKSVGRSGGSRERFSRSFTREQSVGRSFSKETKTSIQHSFSIDTSVNRTFQSKSNNKNECSNFDARRQRAASVGRTLISDSSLNREFNETRNADNSRENDTKRIKYKRACSVGREIVQENKLDFKDIKADLKSFKLKDNFNIVKGKDQHKKNDYRKVTDSKKISDCRSRKEMYDTLLKYSSTNTKYSPRKNNRDPRVRRENYYENKEKHNEKYRSNSQEMQRYGIVYSNDNISKGNILGPGYGVKNYKIPKLKRPQELKDKNESNTKTKAEKEVDKSFKKSVSQVNLEKRNANQNVKTRQMDPTLAKKHIEDNESKLIKTDTKTVYNEKSDPNEKSKLEKIKSENSQISDSQIKIEVLEDDTNKDKHEDKSGDKANTLSNISIDNVEKRITRSVSKNITGKFVEKIDTSPIKRTKKISKLVIYDSDSDSEQNEEEKNKVADTSNIEENKANRQCELQNYAAITNEKNVESHVRHDDMIAWNKQASEKTEEKQMQEVSKVLDSNFGIDEMEIFSDNVVSDPVIDNIKDLIADLDHDLDSSKKANTSSNFTKELSLETMMENITCPGNNENKESDIKMVDSLKLKVEKGNSNQSSNMTVASEVKENTNAGLEQIKESSLEVVSSEKLEFNVNKTKEPNFEKNEINIEDLDTPACENAPKKSDIIKTNLIDDMRSNEAIVSTSVDDEKQRNKISKIDEVEDEMTFSESTPDSTITCNEINENVNIQKSLPDSTNEAKCEMSSDVSSTHNTTGTNQNIDLSESSSSQTPAAQVEAIGKLLSILQDIKIKELIGLLGDQSSENEKIKKKLEKLREIVSEDEDTSKNEKTENDHRILNEDKDLQNTCNESAVQSNEKEKISTNLNKEDNESNSSIDTKKEIVEDLKKKSIDCPNEETVANTNIEIPKVAEDNNDATKENEENQKIQPVNEGNESNEVISEVVKENLKTSKKGGKGNVTKKGKKKSTNKIIPTEGKRLTRSDAANLQIEKPPPKRMSRELKKLQADIKKMFVKDDIFSATGIRMCRLAKLVDDKTNPREEQPQIECIQSITQEPVVLLKKFNDINTSEELETTDISIKKRSLKCKKTDEGNTSPVAAEGTTKGKFDIVVKPGPKSKTRVMQGSDNSDPYLFETDSVIETPNLSGVQNNDTSSDSESESLSSLKSFGSLELCAEAKKKVKRKRTSKGWKAGIIKSKNKKKKLECKQATMQNTGNDDSAEIQNNSEIQAPNCFIDKTYCFRKNQYNYNCRMCSYSGMEIVQHYKKQHPHYEIPLSRMSPAMAKEAIKESVKLNFQIVSKVSSKKYVCRFCFEEFGNKKPVLEAFFWHIVSMHTGEYKQLCSECLNVTRCPFNLDIPPPPKEAKGQLIGYICEKCNYTQISLENLKTHVITRHNDEQTAVYTINLAVMTKVAVNNILEKAAQRETEINCAKVGAPRMLRSSRSNLSFAESSDVKSDTTEGSSRKKLKEETKKPTKIQSKITFENDNTDETSNFDGNDICTLKTEIESNEHHDRDSSVRNDDEEKRNGDEITTTKNVNQEAITNANDILDYPHFKVKYTETGSKEYICCINRNHHYKTALLISLKKHVQLKHSEVWDGYCYICKVIVTPQGVYYFKDCLQHMLDKHNNFPVIEEANTNSEPKLPEVETNISDKTSNDPIVKSYINVRPLSDLITKPPPQSPIEKPSLILPIIESVISLGAGIEQSRPSPTYPVTDQNVFEKKYKYEEAQAEIMLRKHRVVLEAMMSPNKLVQVFKCAGRYCSFTTDSAEDALLHASTHMRVGGEDSLKCVYCDYDSSNNAVDLITHVFNNHGCCQFVCSVCFYRAAASQLVDAHIKRVHESSANKSILHTSIQTALIKEHDILSREAAVHYYICQVGRGTDAACKFKTYTPGKFSEHMNMRHRTDKEFPCNMCPVILSTPTDLVSHIKSHGLKLYQCAWCVYGADNELGLLTHSSSNHPDKLPKAYLRIITNKEGTKEFRVLPLAHLNKTEISSISIAPGSFKENPVREAERSIELQKLIAQTTFVIESSAVTSSDNGQNSESHTNSQETLQEKGVETISELPISSKTAPNQFAESNTLENRLVSVIKMEKEETPTRVSQILSDIVCLDSDEEDTHNVIDLSEDGSNAPTTTSSLEHLTQKTVPHTRLFLCSRCRVTLKYCSTFKKHINSCFSQVPDPISCAHCPLKFDKKDIVCHYTSVHSQNNKTFVCFHCPRKFNTLAILKEHEKTEHNSTLNSASNVESNVKKNATGPTRRKRCQGSKEKCSEPPEKIKRFGPHDVHLLPINPILDDSVFCSLCEFSTKVRHNMVRHLQLHAQQQPVPQTAPVNPVPHLETNEKHFDKMLNLASSSITTRMDKSKSDNSVASLIIPPEVASRYPKYIPEKHRLTCGAKGCSYISVDESMLKCHWETLHSGTSVFHCVHCPPYQHLDTSKPLTASRVLAHLKMHDTNLYACSLCSYYHYRRQILEHHLNDEHKGGQVLVVREEGIIIPTSPVQPQIAAPTMDLKAWHCGLCKFKSLLRSNAVDHCAKTHNSKMQYKCAYCAFRTSNSENVLKHQSKSHTGRPEEIFYYYYQEGTVPDDPDGTPLWQKQSQKFSNVESKIKSEAPSENSSSPSVSRASTPLQAPVNPEIDLNLVKKEVVEPSEESIEDLCKEFGEFCEPNGLKYKCSLCKLVIEDTLEAMQSHLYEELKYRKWGCSICTYKAFHKAGLKEHMEIEHRQNRDPVALQVDVRVETWVAKLLEHQTALIQQNIANLAKQKEEIFRAVPGTVTKAQSATETAVSSCGTKTLNLIELQKTFGAFGEAMNMSFCCPKCNALFKEEDAMQNHLESELNKIRWFCSHCCVTFQTYHEAQFHCRTTHSGFSRPVEVIRDPSVRFTWIEAVIHAQKLSMNHVPARRTDTESELPGNVENENSLLVVRYEEKVPTPEEQMALRTSVASHDSDEEKLVIDEPKESRKKTKGCPHCDYNTTNKRILHDHILRHYGLKPYTCIHCNLDTTKKALLQHYKDKHAFLPLVQKITDIPRETPAEYLDKISSIENNKLICYVCRSLFTESDSREHTHNNEVPLFGRKNDIVVKCSHCGTIFSNSVTYLDHHNKTHPDIPTNYLLTKLTPNVSSSKEVVYACGNCDQKFSYLRDIKLHVNTYHFSNPIYTTLQKVHSQDGSIQADEGLKRKADDVTMLPSNKRVARKSTTKLPCTKLCARKSTTKLPFDIPGESQEFSYYGTKPSSDGLENVTAMMSFCNTMMPFTLKKLSEIININPIVSVTKTMEK